MGFADKCKTKAVLIILGLGPIVHLSFGVSTDPFGCACTSIRYLGMSNDRFNNASSR